MLRLVRLTIPLTLALAPCVARAQGADSLVAARGDSVSVRLVDVDLRAAVQALARYLDRPVIFGAVNAARVTLETPRPVPRAEVVPLLRGLLESQSLALVDTNGMYHVRAREAPRAATEPARTARPAGTPELFIIRLRHARAADVAATVNALYGRAGALGEIGDRSGTLSGDLRAQQVSPQSGALVPQSVPGTAGRAAQLAGDVTIVPDAGSNSLLVRAARGDFELITAAVQQLDVRPLQVLIEVIIAELRRDRSFSYGVSVTAPRQRVPERLSPGGGGTVEAEASQVGLAAGDFALRLIRSGPGLDFDATIRAAAARGDVNILSRPLVIAANNETAEINVGSQRPFVQVQRSLPTDAPSRDQVVQYKDVGTRLSVRPTISADGYVMLEVTQEVNAATAETQFDAPVISTRSVQTRLLVRDSATVALGGLADRQRDRNQAGIPVLSSIPILGGLFGRSSRRTTETELFLFITPRVIRSDEEAARVTAPLQKRAERDRDD